MATDQPARPVKRRRPSGRAAGAEQPEASRQRILDAALSIAAERGYEGTSMSMVSKQSGLAVTSIYWHFGSKEGLLAAVLEQGWSVWFTAIPTWDEMKQAPEDRLEPWLGAVASSLVAQPEFLRFGLLLTLETRDVEPEAKSTFLRVHQEAIDRFSYAVKGARTAAGLECAPDRIRELATTLVALLNGAFMELYAAPGFDGLEYIVQSSRHILLAP